MARRRREARQDERQGQRETFGRGGDATRYQMKQRMVSIGNDYWIDDQHGKKCFKVDGKAVRVRDTLIFEDPHGNKLCKIQQRIARVKDTMKVEDPDGGTLASIKKAVITPVRDRWTIKIENGPDLSVQGNIVDHEYNIEQGNHKVAEVSKKWFRVRDSYGVQVEPGQNDIVILAATVAIDMMTHN